MSDCDARTRPAKRTGEHYHDFSRMWKFPPLMRHFCHGDVPKSHALLSPRMSLFCLLLRGSDIARDKSTHVGAQARICGTLTHKMLADAADSAAALPGILSFSATAPSGRSARDR